MTSVVVVPPTSPANKILAYCWTASLDGTIRYWDFSAPELMKTINIRVPIHSMVIWYISSILIYWVFQLFSAILLFLEYKVWIFVGCTFVEFEHFFVVDKHSIFASLFPGGSWFITQTGWSWWAAISSLCLSMHRGGEKARTSECLRILADSQV